MKTSPKNRRVDELLALYDKDDTCVAALMCDRHDPGRTAYRIVAPDLSVRVLTYGELRRESEKFAAVLRSLGVVPGDRVATLMGKSSEYLVTLMATWRLGAVHVPLFTAFAPPAIALRLAGSAAKVVVCDSVQQPKLAAGDDFPADPPWRVVTTGAAADGVLSFHALMEHAEPGFAAAARGGQAPFILIFTSGTTGRPKGVVVPIRALAAFHAYCEFGLDLKGEDVFWCAADPGWAYGLYYGVLATFITGASSIMLQGSFKPETTMAVLVDERVTNFAAAPTVYRALRTSGVLPRASLPLRCASSAGEPLTPEVNDWAKQVLGTMVHDHYGQTETGMLINNHHHETVGRPVKAGSMGQAMPGWKAAILHAERDVELGPTEFGRVAIALPESPLAWFTGYEADTDKTAEKFSSDGRWYLTGDVGMVDDAGYFHFSARDDDVIIMAGYRIGPFEAEAAIVSHPAVAEAAVIAAPDGVRGEVMEAYVVLMSGYSASADLERDIQQRVKLRYAAHAYPRVVHFIEALPKTPSGKVQRFVLKQKRSCELAGGTSEAVRISPTLPGPCAER